MPGKALDLEGKRIGKLKVIKRIENSKNGQSRWLCECECGNEKIISSGMVSDKRAKMCCNECMGKRKYIHVNGKLYYMHGMKNTPLYKIWASMKIRCQNKCANRYERYGGRGITICHEWTNENGFMNFYNWAIKNGYKDGLSLDRINVNGNYEPSNCRWITMKEQQNNKSNNHLLTYNGKTQTISQWEEETGIKYATIYARLKYGWSVERALTEKRWGRSGNSDKISKPKELVAN